MPPIYATQCILVRYLCCRHQPGLLHLLSPLLLRIAISTTSCHVFRFLIFPCFWRYPSVRLLHISERFIPCSNSLYKYAVSMRSTSTGLSLNFGQCKSLLADGLEGCLIMMYRGIFRAYV